MRAGKFVYKIVERGLAKQKQRDESKACGIIGHRHELYTSGGVLISQ